MKAKAERLLDELYNTPEDKRVSLIERYLVEAYDDGVKNDWWKEFDKELYKKRHWK